MIEIREVLRRHASGQSLRQIARETGLDRKTVRRYVEAPDEAQADVSDGGVQEVAHRVQARPLPPRSEQRSVLVPHLDPLRKWLCEDELRLTKVQLDITAVLGHAAPRPTDLPWSHHPENRLVPSG